MPTAPVVSILLPTYNRAAFLPQAFEAIRAQEFTDWELIIVDDGSRDATEEVVRAQTAGWPQPVRYIRQKNAGAYGARNTGLDLVGGRYVAFYDSDDLWLPHHLRDCVTALEENKDVDWVYGASKLVHHATGAVVAPSSFYIGDQPKAFLGLRRRTAARHLHIIEDERAIEYAILKGLYAGLQVSVIRREVFDGYRFEATKRNEAEDQLLVTHALASGRKLAYFDNLHLVYYVHEQNSSATGGQSVEKHLRIFRALIEGFEELPARVALTRPQRRALRQRLCKEYFWHLGYVLRDHPGREAEGLAFMRRGLSYSPWSPVLWSVYLVSCLRVATGLPRKSHPQPARST
jgi:glycosyltransferase involved in cell wall biosynthesis